MNKIIILIALVLLLTCKVSLNQVESIRSPVKVIEWQKVYRCCEGSCYLLKSYIEQDVVIKEVKHKDINHSKDPIIFSNRYCPK